MFDGADPERTAAFFDHMMELELDGITVSPGYAYERAPDQQHFLNRERTKTMFRDILARGNGGKNWAFTNSPFCSWISWPATRPMNAHLGPCRC